MRTRPRVGIAIAVALVLGSLAPGAAQGVAAGAAPAGPVTGPVTAFFDVAYEVVGSETFELDVYEPGDGLTHPGVLLVHGGAWTKGDKSLWVEEGRALAEDGFVAFAANFRLSPPGGTSHSPDPVADLQAAMSWIRANAATYGVDPLAVGALGDSSGGNLALMLGTTGTDGGSKADAVVAWSAATDLPARPGSGSSQIYVGCPYASCPDAWVAASPIDQVDASDAPAYLANSTKEHTPLSQATSMADALAAAGVPEQLRVIKGKLHARAYEAKVWSQSLSFLHQYLDGATPAAARLTHATRVLSSPVVGGGIVYVGAEDGSLHAFDAVTGSPLWSTVAGAIIDSTPALADGRVYAGSQDGSVRAFDAVTGSPVWQSAAPLGSFADVSPVTDGGHLFAASEDGALQALDDGTGGSVWTTGPGTGVVARIQFRPAVSGGLVVTGSNNGRLSALDEGTGGAMWTRPASGTLFVWCPTISGVVIYVPTVTAFEEGTLDAVSLSTGTTMWSTKTPTSSVAATCPAEAAGVVYTANTDGRLYAFDASAGGILWSQRVGDLTYASPAVAGGLAYAGSQDGSIHAFDASTGTFRWSAATGGPIRSSPTVAGGTVYVGSSDGDLYAFEATTGALLWQQAVTA